jgi:hypothetical protein
MTYGEMQEPIGYRQLACQSIGSEICSVPDFARFVAAHTRGPRDEPPGRGVLKPETVAIMLGGPPTGVGYGFSVTNMQGDRAPADLRADVLLAHFGGNPGWTAHFLIDTTRREGFVVANNSSFGGTLQVAVQRIWLNTVLGMDAGTDPPPTEGITVPIHKTAVRVSVALWVLLLAAAVLCGIQISRGKRRRSRPSVRRVLLILAPAIIATLTWFYVFYAPDGMPLPLPAKLLSIWKVPLIDYATALLIGWSGVALLFTLFSSAPPAVKENDRKEFAA